jgi:hypothetical protein
MLKAILSRCFSSPDNTIKSARDWLRWPPRSAQLLTILQVVGEDVTITIRFRIVTAWACKEENDQDIFYIEAILPEGEEVFPEIEVKEQNNTVKGKYKLTRFVVCFQDYKQLMVLQNSSS